MQSSIRVFTLVHDGSKAPFEEHQGLRIQFEEWQLISGKGFTLQTRG